MKKLVDAAVNGCAVASGALIALVCLVVSYEVAARYLFAAPTTWSIDVSTFALFWATFLGAPYALRERAHVAVDVVIRRAGASTQRRFAVLNGVLITLFAALLAWQGALACWDAYVYGEVALSAVRFPLYLPLLAIPVGAVVLALQALALIAARAGEQGNR